MVLSTLAYGVQSLHPLPLLDNLLLLQSWYSLPGSEGNSVAWCLSDLMFFYLAFPYLARLSSRGVTLLAMVLAALSYGGYALLPLSDYGITIYIHPLSRLVDFLLGMLLYRLYKGSGVSGFAGFWQARGRGFRLGWLVVTALLYVLTLLYSRSQMGWTPASIFPFYLPSALVIIYFAMTYRTGQQGRLDRLLSQRWLLYLGEISFSFYMVHNLVILSVKQLLERSGLLVHWSVRLVLTLLVTLLVSVLVNRYFEQPIANYYARRWGKRA